MKRLIGIDIGGTKCSVCLGFENEFGLTIQDSIVFPTNASPKVEWTIQSIIRSHLWVSPKKHDPARRG